ncbi:hypothetical protein [Spirillospora sp. CA-294931]|uniref:hypothetical protein n=1 Tax=Spirillospora sp. CA-294931 TaxID=3240042 RepID=UPI003D8EB1EE
MRVAAGLGLGAVVLGGLRAFWTDGRPVERVCYVIGVVLMVSGVFHLGVFAVDGGPWEGPVSWRKAVTFGLSFGLTLVTIAWVATFVRLGDRARNVILGVLAAACAEETALATLQSWRHVPSHFNMETSVDTAIARMLAVGGGLLIVTLVALTVAAFRDTPETEPSMRLAVRVGFVALMGALLSGAAMIARGVVEEATGHQEAAYHVAGALKPAHAVTMHAILVLPALAWLLTFTGLPEARRTRVVALACWAYAAAAPAVIAVSAARFAAA